MFHTCIRYLHTQVPMFTERLEQGWIHTVTCSSFLLSPSGIDRFLPRLSFNTLAEREPGGKLLNGVVLASFVPH